MPRGLLHGGTPHARERHTCHTNGAQTAKSERLMCVCIDVYLCIRRSSTLWIWPLDLWDRVSAWPVGWLTLGNTLTRPGNPRDVYTHMQVTTASWVFAYPSTPCCFLSVQISWACAVATCSYDSSALITTGASSHISVIFTI